MVRDAGGCSGVLSFCGDESVGFSGDLPRRLDEPQPAGVIEYLQEEVRVLEESLGKESRFDDDQRLLLALKSKRLGRKARIGPPAW